MPEDLRQKILEEIARSGDESYKRLALLLFRVEEMFLERVAALADQMTIPAQQHADDHSWIQAARKVDGGVRSVMVKVTVSIIEKGALVGAGVVAARISGWF